MQIHREAVSKDKNIIPRLEASLIHWTRQIKEVTSAQQESGSNETNEDSGPLDEIEFWRARDVDLSRLRKQLQSEELQRVLQVLEAVICCPPTLSTCNLRRLLSQRVRALARCCSS